MVIKKRSRIKQPGLKGHGSGKISYEARKSCHKLGKFFDFEEEEEAQEEKEEE